MAKVLVCIAPGFEEIEAITVIDLLRRGGIAVTVAGLGDGTVVGSHGIGVLPDCTLDQAMEHDYDMLVLPGGLPGADKLQADARILQLVRAMAESDRYTAAICAAPKVLAAAGVLDGRRATSYPGFLDATSASGLKLSLDPVVQDGKVITSRGPGTAMDFALTLVGVLAGDQRRAEVEDRLQRPAPASV